MQSPAPFRQRSPQSAAQPGPGSPRRPQPLSSPLPAGPPRGRRRDTSRCSRHFSERQRRARLPARILPRPRARPGLPARKETPTAREAPPLSGQLRNLIGSLRVIGSSLCRQPAAMLCAGQGAAAVGPCPRLAPGSPPGSEGRHGPVQHSTAQHGHVMYFTQSTTPHRSPLPQPRCRFTSSPHPSPHSSSPTSCGLWSGTRGPSGAPAGISPHNKPQVPKMHRLTATHSNLVPLCGLCLSGVLTSTAVTLWERQSALQRWFFLTGY